MTRRQQACDLLNRLDAAGHTRADERQYPELAVLEREVVVELWRLRRWFTLERLNGVLILKLPRGPQRPFRTRR
jgi:hypothetical protein